MSAQTARRLMLAITNRPRIEAAYLAAHTEAHRLRRRLRELELGIDQAREILQLTAVRLPWPPLPRPTRPPTLHEAMAIVLESKGNPWMRTGDLALEIARRSLYRRRDGLPASTKDVSARARAYHRLFVRDAYHIRLRAEQQLTTQHHDASR